MWTCKIVDKEVNGLPSADFVFTSDEGGEVIIDGNSLSSRGSVEEFIANKIQELNNEA